MRQFSWRCVWGWSIPPVPDWVEAPSSFCITLPTIIITIMPVIIVSTMMHAPPTRSHFPLLVTKKYKRSLIVANAPHNGPTPPCTRITPPTPRWWVRSRFPSWENCIVWPWRTTGTDNCRGRRLSNPWPIWRDAV